MRIYGNIISRKGRIDISLENIKRIEDWNELTRHYLGVISAKCVRVFGAMAIEKAKDGQLTDQMQKIIDIIKKLRANKHGKGVIGDDIFDEAGEKNYDAFIKTLEAMCDKKILKKIDGNYDII